MALVGAGRKPHTQVFGAGPASAVRAVVARWPDFQPRTTGTDGIDAKKGCRECRRAGSPSTSNYAPGSSGALTSP
jgi:hypothetical protein